MSADLYFAFVLIVKMAVTAAFVLAATMTAERAGPLLGALVATLPISAGPVYVFLALDHDAQFIAQSALASLAINAVNATFAIVYALFAQKRSLPVSVAGAFGFWLLLAFAILSINWTVVTAAIVNVITLSVCVWLSRPLRHVRMPPFRARWYDLAMRALLVALLVGVVVTMSFRIGPRASGILAVFPVVLLSVIIILHRRVGGKPAAAVLSNAPLGLVGFGFACVMLHFTAAPFGTPIALALALTTSVVWSLLVLLTRRYGLSV